jgi:hypothetical protein
MSLTINVIFAIKNILLSNKGLDTILFSYVGRRPPAPNRDELRLGWVWMFIGRFNHSPQA